MNNNAADGVKINLLPTPQENGTDAIRIYYIRNSNRMVDNDSIRDIPEFVDYVMQFMKVRVYEKEQNPMLQMAVGMLQSKKQNMVNTLSNMVDDGDNLIEPDTSFYEEMGQGV